MAMFRRDQVKAAFNRAGRLERHNDIEGAAWELYRGAGESRDPEVRITLALQSSEKAEAVAREAIFLLKTNRGAEIHEMYDSVATQLRCFRLAAEAAELAGDVGRAMEMRKSLAGVPSFGPAGNGVASRVSDAKAQLRR